MTKPDRTSPLEVAVHRAPRVRAPASARIREWARAAVGAAGRGAELSVRIVGAAEGRRLNSRWRDRDYATNVLSFPAPCQAAIRGDLRPLGDLVICAPVVEREAREQGKPRQAHWAHMVIHGVLHLVGHDHVDDADARRMEGRERRLLRRLGYPDPYQEAA